MKLTAIILLSACLTASAKGHSQNVTLSLKDAPLEKVFSAIEKQTGYYFTYTRELLQGTKPVSLEVKDVSLREVLAICLKDQPVTYQIIDKAIIIKQQQQIKVAVELPSPIDIHGRVINEKGEPVEGASVKIKGLDIGTSTNENGEFTLNVPLPEMVLIISGVNIEAIEVRLNARTNLTINVKTAIKPLDEIIAKGYYSTTKRLNTGSVSKVTAEEISKQPVSNPLAALEGRVPGLLITQANGLPGSNFTVRIRGQNSIQNGNSPLYIIDGVPFLNDADRLTQRSGINAASPFNTIDPSEIESIEILKDADATAIYGSRGANGVILITIKKGKAGKIQTNASVYSGWGKVTRTMKFMNTAQYLEMRHEAFFNDGVTPTPSNAYDLLVWDTTRYTDLKKKLIGGTAHTDNCVLQLSGGNSNTKFSVGANYYRETTVFPGDNADKRTSVNFSLSQHSANDKFSLSIASSYATDNNDLIMQDLTQFINLPPVIPELFDSPGHLNWSKGGFSFNNPLANTLRKYKVVTDRLTADAVVQYSLFKGLTLKANIGYNELIVNETNPIPISSQDPSFNPTGSAFFGNNQVKSWIIEPQLEYSRQIGPKGKLEALAGTSRQENSGYQTSITGLGYTNDNILGSTTGAQTLNTSNASQLYRYEAIYGRINFNWDEKYLINLTGRRDGSSRFGPGKQFANFGAFGLGWIFSKENFIQKAIPILSFGKLRLSYGITGNDLIGNYNYLDTYSPTQFPYQGVPSLFPTKLFNADYSWEQIRKFDVGIDLGILKDKISLTLDWFKNKSDNQIINYLLPGQTGFNSILRNFPGVVQNTGWELQLNSTNFKRINFKWTSSLNFTTSENKLISFPGLATSSYSSRYIIGKPLNASIGATYAGIDPATGIYQFYDKNNQLTFSPGTADYHYTGTTDPKYYGGLQNNFVYKRWELLFLFEFRKQKGIDPVFSTGVPVGYAGNQPTIVLDRWQKPGDIRPYEQFSQTFGIAGSAMEFIYNSDAILRDASFIRLKNLSLSYTLPALKTKKEGIQKARLYIEAQNLLTLTHYKGADPETQTNFYLPPLRMFTVGIQITL